MTENVLHAIDTVEVKRLPPDPDVMKAIGLSHDLTTGLADLVDNCIDANASKILIRFIRIGGRLRSLLVIDNGRGMGDKRIDAAMTVGRRRDYKGDSLGHFGMGLKAASFSQADTLTVLSKKRGGLAVGRRIKRAHVHDFLCEVLDPGQSGDDLEAVLSEVEADGGTLVKWDSVRTFPTATDPTITDEYLSHTINRLRLHLGLTLHRILGTKVSITIDVTDGDGGGPGAPSTVQSVDPFGYKRSGKASYPKDLICDVGGERLSITAHIWPPRSEALGFRLGGDPSLGQGFYFYRNNRLIEARGWKNAASTNRRLQLARVEVDISNWPELFDINMEKSSVHPRPEFIQAVESAVAKDGTSFEDYLADADGLYRESNKRGRTRQPVLEAGTGMPAKVRKAIQVEYPRDESRAALEIRWTDFYDGDEFFEVDRESNTLWLNKIYRKGMLAGRRGGVNDLPVVKALLFLLAEDVFRGAAFGPRDKDNAAAWQAVLTAAAKEETGQ